MGLSTVANGGNEGSKTAGGGFFHEELEGEGERRSIGVRRRGFLQGGLVRRLFEKGPCGKLESLGRPPRRWYVGFSAVCEKTFNVK